MLAEDKLEILLDLIKRSTNEELVLKVLHRANCEVITDPTCRFIEGLIFSTGTSATEDTYTVFTEQFVIDIPCHMPDFVVNHRDFLHQVH